MISRVQLKKWIIASSLLVIVICACGYIFIFHIQSYGVSSRDGWLFEQEGYQKALQLSRKEDRPILFYFRRKQCQICKDFEKKLLNTKAFNQFSQAYIKVRYTIDENLRQEQFAKRYPIRIQPALMVQFQKNPPLSTHIILPMNKIWVAQATMESGNRMPLSITTLKLSLKRITEIARDQAQARDKKTNLTSDSSK